MPPKKPENVQRPRVIVHADMDAFYAAVEQLDNPHLRGKPLLIGVDHPRSVVSTASYEARPFGVGSAMPMVEAKRRCPQAIIVPPRMGRYAEVSEQIMTVFAQFSPRVEALSLDEAFLDMTGAEKLFGTQEQLARQVKNAVKQATGLNVSVGVAPCKFVAKVASDIGKPDGLVVVQARDQLGFLWPLPLTRLWGVGKHAAAKLHDLGLKTIGDVAHADPEELHKALGSLGAHVFALAHAEDPRPVQADREAQSIGSEETLDEDVVGAAAMQPILLRAADRIARRLRHAGLLAGGVRVKLKTAKFQLLTRQTVLQPPTDSAKVLLQEGLALLPQFDLKLPMRLVGLAAYDLRPHDAPRQGLLFEETDRKKQKKLDTALDGLRERFGSNAVKRGTDVERGERQRFPRTDGEVT